MGLRGMLENVITLLLKIMKPMKIITIMVIPASEFFVEG